MYNSYSDTDSENEELVNSYTKALGYHKKHMIVRSIHRHTDLCFNTIFRELVYAIYNCFKEANINTMSMNDCIWGLNVTIPIEDTPKIPPFSNLLHHYKEGFHRRLAKIERSLDRKNIPWEHLFQRRKKLDTDIKFIEYINLPFPVEVLSIIASFIRMDLEKYDELRDHYRDIRGKYR
tara:strand:+ start:2298 stop:2831 length:534 start_codon:yes stop_codon:yes gene_type:complete